ncbi:unnamed protein product [Porites evermanni]|uniref:Folate receptor-like domain-containing protein n=1 Tax=Porites evermanni TaxID=104178 RepID=A0ABN8LTQ7_9CNID|nr:unnamed protein product [Porites evermanni]
MNYHFIVLLQVLAEREWTMATFRKCTEDVFKRLYPDEPKLRISSLQNEFHFDIPLSYKVDDVLVDAGLVFAVEEEISLVNSLSVVSPEESELKSKTSDVNEEEFLKDYSSGPSRRKRAKSIKKTSRSVKIQTHLSGKAVDSSSSTRVSSTTSPTSMDQASSMMPQIVEKISEDSEVDIESVDDSIVQSFENTSNTTEAKRKTVLINGARASFRRDTHIFSKQTTSKREQGGYPWIHERHAMKSLSANRVFVFLFFGAYWNVCNTEDDAVIRSEPLQYCPYFKNRGPSRQENLGNCSWYKESSCCYDEEIEFAFRQLTPLIGASGDCLKYLNYLYCYICAPNQNTFFKDFTLTVCREFCDRVYDSCKNAVLKGRKIKYIYKNGEQFCKGRRFETDMEANGKCFTFKPRPTVKSGSQRTDFCMGFVVFALFGKRCVLF